MTSALRIDDPVLLGGYELLARLGEGGMGTVYLAKGHGDRQVAIKVIKPENSRDPEFRARFRSEVACAPARPFLRSPPTDRFTCKRIDASRGLRT